MVLEQQPVIPLMSVLDQQGTMATYSASNGLEFAGLSLPTSCLKVPLDSKGIQNEGDLTQGIFCPALSSVLYPSSC